jgi:hypothetical protein
VFTTSDISVIFGGKFTGEITNVQIEQKVQGEAGKNFGVDTGIQFNNK